MEKYKIRKSREYNKKIQKYLPGGEHYNFRAFAQERPIHFVKGAGSRLWDMDGNEYLDLYCKYGAMILGHNHPRYNEALKKRIDGVTCVNKSDIELDILEMINRFMPAVEMMRFGLSGTEIVQNAIRLARAYTGKNRFIRFTGHYHGSADNVVGGVANDLLFPVPKEHPGEPRGTEGRAKGALETQSFLLQWNNPGLLENIIHKYHDDIAAILTEPICLNGGGIMPRPGYLKKMRDLCDQYNIALIFDEVITGFRVGLSGAQGYFGIEPDITTLGKALASGLPVSMIGGKRKVMELYDERRVMHAGTFNGYALGLEGVKASLDILSDDGGKRYDEMAGFAQKFAEMISVAAKKAGLPMVVQGCRGVPIFHCCERPEDTIEAFDESTFMKDSVIADCLLAYGIMVAPVSRMYMNVTINDDDVAFFKSRVDDAMKDAAEIINELSE